VQEYVFHVNEEEAGERVDRYLSSLMDSHSRSYLQKLLKQELVLLKLTEEHSAGASPRPTNYRVLRASYRIQDGDHIHVRVPDAIFPPIEAEDIPLDVLYEDDSLLVVNKTKGMVVHPAPGHYQHTLVNALLYHCRNSLSGINGVLRPGIVHRIDRDTTGALLVCKNDVAHQEIARQLKEHSMERKYVAITKGRIGNEEGTIQTFIGRDRKDRKKMTTLPLNDERGKMAITHYKVLEYFSKHTLIECRLETGRTHQIRVHLAHLGYPILGDTVYGSADNPLKLEGQTLHALSLGFIHPVSQEFMKFEAPLPGYFEELMAKLR